MKTRDKSTRNHAVGHSERHLATNQRGVTLVELLVTLTLFGMLLSVGVPTYDRIAVANRMSAQINELSAATHYTRSEAIKRGEDVLICVANTTVTDCLANSNDWGNGWIIKVDVSNQILRKREAISTRETMQEVGTPTNVGAMTFDLNGFTTDFRTISICGDNSTATTGIIINAVGQVMLLPDADGDGVREDASGADIVCS